MGLAAGTKLGPYEVAVRRAWKGIGPSQDMTGRVGSVRITDDGNAYVYNHRDPLHTLYVAAGVK